ncbi:Regulatory sensor-transducer, BlaR1/MecR1 family [Myxococcus hansupus]|uniref:Regulatory sensor-transducer, BlaR1/MecR1 family n=1 Tax=Pseudomyxococcus hansupus TaxID=1297742 RepID=A0A0H4XND4_9BACT|nr:M56 family metallopeptidase [Myxococcus hansupus]AKQ69897.1 Regulatory sensor-transducer, BlaR1/MecR1 family [Myxococcus hansupus]
MSRLLMESMGWALLHSLWQGTLVALMLAVALIAAGRRAAHARYALACGALVLALALPVASGWRHFHGAPAPMDAAATVETPAPRTVVTVGLPMDAAVLPTPESWARTVMAHEAATEEWIDADMAEDGPAFGVESTLLARMGPLLVVGGLLLQRALSGVEAHLQWLVLAWVAGVGLSSGRMAAEWMKLRRLTDRAVPAPEPWQERMDALARKLGLRRAVRLLQTYDVDVPSAVGWLSPVVLLPVSTLSGLPARQLEMVLAHELAHIRRHDFAVNLAQVMVETLLFFHPAVRWISSVIRVERENCCDDVAVAASGNSVSYARALTALEALRILPETPSPAMSALGGSLPERVRRLITLPTSRCASRWAAGASVLTLISSLAVAAPLTSLVLGQLGVGTDADLEDRAETAGAQATDASLPGTATLHRAPRAVHAPEMHGAPVGVAAFASPVVAATPGALPAGIATPALAPAPVAVPAAIAAPAAPPAPPAPPAPLAPPELDSLSSFSTSIALTALTAAEVALGNLAQLDAETPRTPRERSRRSVDTQTQVGAGQQLSVNQLVELKVAGVTPEHVQQLTDLGYAPTVANLVGMSHAGVTPDYAKSMNARFGRKMEARELTQLRHMGVTPAYIESLQSAGFSVDDPKALVHARAVGVDEAYVRELKATGYTNLSLHELAQLRAVGVDPAFIDAMSKNGLSKLSPKELMQLRAMGISSDWLAEIRKAGVETKDAKTLQRLRATGVDAGFIRELADAGMKDLSVDELVRLRNGGVDAEFIRKMRGNGSK